jgi:hypothetical protein
MRAGALCTRPFFLGASHNLLWLCAATAAVTTIADVAMADRTADRLTVAPFF